jgi:transcriptional regulator with XRE-family HTH domain
LAYGERLRELRAERRLSLRQVEERGGPNKDTMSLLERGVHRPHPQTLGRIAQAFDMSVAELRAELEAAEYPLAQAPPSQQLTLNGELEEERRANWDAAVRSARQLQEHGRTRTEELLALWQESNERGEDPAERRAYLDEIGGLLQRAYDAEMALLANLEAGLSAGDREAANLLAAGAKGVPNPGWTEVQAADRFYRDLFGLVQGAGLSIRTDGAQEGEAAYAGQAAAHTVEEPLAA